MKFVRLVYHLGLAVGETSPSWVSSPGRTLNLPAGLRMVSYWVVAVERWPFSVPAELRLHFHDTCITVLFLGLRLANERRCYFVTSSLIGLAQT